MTPDLDTCTITRSGWHRLVDMTLDLDTLRDRPVLVTGAGGFLGARHGDAHPVDRG